MSTSDIIVTTSNVTITPGVVMYVSTSSAPSGTSFLVANLLSELDTDSKKVTARTNLGLQNVDGGTFE